MTTILIALGGFLAGWLLGWLMGISRTTTIYRALMREGANPHAWGLLLLLLLPQAVWAQAPCTHYVLLERGGR